MRNITHIVVHCTGGTQDASIDAIKKYWKKIGWTNVGYHHIVKANGEDVQLLAYSKISNGVKGKNANIVNVSYIGGVDKHGKPIDNRTDKQKAALITRLTALKKMFPNAQILGHRDLSPDKDGDGVVEKHEWVKSCPCFNAIEEYKNIRA